MKAPAPRVIPYLLGLPPLIFVGALFLLPVGFLILQSFVKRDAAGGTAFSLATYAAVLSDPYTLNLIGRTVQVSAITTVVCLLAAFPVALYMRQVHPRTRTVVTFVLLAPLLTSVVVRTLAWIILLGPKGVVNATLAAAGLDPVALIYNQLGVVIGLAHVFFGYMALSIMASVSRIDENLLLAASNLGAGRWSILREIILPLSMPGVLAGSILVFTLSASNYATPQLLGGTAAKLLANEIYDDAINYLDWSTAAALSCLLFVGIMALVALASALAERGRGRMIFE